MNHIESVVVIKIAFIIILIIMCKFSCTFVSARELKIYHHHVLTHFSVFYLSNYNFADFC